ncbi:MAG: glycosyltransferase 61 family protein [bacterium]
MEEDRNFLYSEEYYGDLLKQEFYAEKPLGLWQYQNARILPTRSGLADEGGLVSKEGSFIDGTGLHRGLGGKYPFDENAVFCSRETVIFIGMLCPIWGHCITDNLRRLWFLFSEAYKEKYASCKIVYLPMKGFSFSGSFAELLSVMGIPYERFRPVTRITQFKTVIVPDECFFVGEGRKRFFTKEYRELIGRVRAYAESHSRPTGCEKLYFTYSHYKKGKQVGEEKLEAFFQEKGYQVIAPERSSFKEQLNLLWNCKEFASTIGSCSHNVIFLREGTRVTLIPRAYYLTEYQAALNQVYPQKLSFADASASLFVDRKNPWTGPWYFFVTPELLRCFEDERETDQAFWNRQLGDFKKYRRIGLRNVEGKDIVAPEFYLKKSWEYLSHIYGAGTLVKTLKKLKRIILH